MSRIKNTFNRLKKKNETALIPYIMAGDPDLAATKKLILEMEKAGCDIIELGAPFSDPLADGPTIQKAAIRSLRHHTSIADVLGLVADVRKVSSIPLIIMTYYNLIFHYGEERFVNDAVAAGLDGMILPDLPPEEAGDADPLREEGGARYDLPACADEHRRADQARVQGRTGVRLLRLTHRRDRREPRAAAGGHQGVLARIKARRTSPLPSGSASRRRTRRRRSRRRAQTA